MIHTLSAIADPLEHRILRDMFVARKRVFVDLLGWDVPVLDAMFEIDQFDHEAARYLVVTDHVGGHRASARLLPTTRSFLLGDLFPELCEGLPPRGEPVFEITRFCLDRSLRTRERRSARDTLIIGLVDHALAHGIRSYIAIAGMGWFRQIRAFGWQCRPLGLPRVVRGEMLVALEISIETNTRQRLAEAGIIGLAPVEVAA